MRLTGLCVSMLVAFALRVVIYTQPYFAYPRTHTTEEKDNTGQATMDRQLFIVRDS